MRNDGLATRRPSAFGRSLSALVAATWLAFSAGCIVQSLHPIHEAAQEVAVPGLLGHWVPVNDEGVPDIDRGLWRFEDESLTTLAGGNTLKLSWRCFKTGEVTFMEGAMHQEELEAHRDQWSGFWVPTRSLCKVVLEGNRLSLIGLDLEWVRKQSLTDQTPDAWLRFEEVSVDENTTVTVFTSSTIEWQEFLAASGQNDEAFPPANAMRMARLQLATGDDEK